MSTPQNSLRATYIKSSYFRVIHADGAFGGFTPQGGLFVGIYSERPPLPDVTVHSTAPETMGREIPEHRVVSTDGLMRELEVGLTMTVPVARSLITWLQERVEVAEAQAKVQQEAQKK